MRDIVKIVVLLAVTFYLVCWFHGKGMIRIALFPVFVQGIYDHILANGNFSYARALASLGVFYVPVIIYLNIITPMIWTPPALPIKAKTAMMKLARLDDGDIEVKQDKPNRLVFYHGALATFGESFYKDHELDIEAACRIDISAFYATQSGVVVAEFSTSRTRRPAEFWVQTETGFVKVNQVQKYVYFITGEDEKYVKIGFSKNPEKIRFPEARRWIVNPRILAKFPVLSMKDESAIHDFFDKYRVNSENELFVFDQDIRDWIENKKREICAAN